MMVERLVGVGEAATISSSVSFHNGGNKNDIVIGELSVLKMIFGIVFYSKLIGQVPP